MTLLGPNHSALILDRQWHQVWIPEEDPVEDAGPMRGCPAQARRLATCYVQYKRNTLSTASSAESLFVVDWPLALISSNS